MHQVGADDEGSDPAVHAIVGFVIGKGGPIGGTAADHAATVHVVGGIARIEPTCV